MAKWDPKVTAADIEISKAELKEALRSIRMKKNRYYGPYRSLFDDVRGTFIEIVEQGKEVFSDGFQPVEDLQQIFRETAPLLYEVYNVIKPSFVEGEEEAVLGDMVIYIYYDLEYFIPNKWYTKILKFVFRNFFLKRASKEAGKYLKIAFDAIEGKVSGLELPDWVDDIIGILSTKKE